jgi:NAD(P)-dependent dehydrogenase (short-subunit alcohol dehydrogenase family)
MGNVDLQGRRVLVIGASSGIGRAVACAAVRAGADTVLAARRLELLEQAMVEAGGGVPAVGDISRPEDCERIVAQARQAGGPLDLVVLAAGTGILAPVVDADAAAWSAVLATNLIGVNQLIRQAVPALAEHGVIAALSSETVGRPRMALGLYGASKAALDQSLLSWQVEHPETRFCRVTIGATQPTGFGDRFESQLLGTALEHWVRHGEMQRRFMAAHEVAEVLLTVLAGALANPGVNIEQLRLRSPSPVAGSLGDIEF